jgi:hypothetical protein
MQTHPQVTIAVLIDPADRVAGGKVTGVSVLGELAARLVVERAEQRTFYLSPRSPAGLFAMVSSHYLAQSGAGF